MKIEDLVEFKTRPLPPGRYCISGGHCYKGRYFIMTTQAIIYTRFSPRPKAADCTSNEKQFERCRNYCERKEYGWDPLFQDCRVSGSILQRPGLQAAIAALEPGMVLVADSSDRLARDLLVYHTICHEVEKAGATIEFADGSPVADTPESKLFRNILADFAAYERDRIRLRTKKGLEKKRKNGERTTGKIPIGWMLDPKDPKRLVVCQHERREIIVACEMSADGHSSGYIAKYLGLCRGKLWSDRTIRKLIKRHSFWAGPNGDLSLEPKHP